MKRFAIRNYGPSRQVPYKGQSICLSNDACIETDDADLAAALEAAGQVYVTDLGKVVAVPEAPKDEERNVTVDDAEAVHDEKFPPEPEEDKPQETGGTQPPPKSTKDKDEIAYSDMSVKELQVLAKDRTPPIKTSGVKKAELVQALIAYDVEG